MDTMMSLQASCSSVGLSSSINNLQISGLPNEVLEHIFSYLVGNIRDLTSCACVCVQWRDVAGRILASRALIVLEECVDTAAEVLLHSSTTYKHLVLKNATIKMDPTSPLTNMWSHCCQWLESLTLDDVIVREDVFTQLLSGCRSLKKLSLRNMEHTLMCGSLLTEEKDRVAVEAALRNVTVFSLQCHSYVSDALLVNFMAVLPPTLTFLSLATCNISYQSSIYKRFYPSDGSVVASPHVATFSCVLRWLCSCAVTLKQLDLSETLLDSASLQRIASIEDLQLHSLNIMGCEQVTNAGIEKLVLQQRYMRRLDISNCYRLTSVALAHVGAHLPAISWLSIRRCGGITAEGVSTLIQQCHNLRHLDLANINGSSPCVVQPSFQRWQPSMRWLSVAGLSLDSQHLMGVAAGVRWLTYLDLSMSGAAVTDYTLRVLCKLLPHLCTFILSECCLITDEGIGCTKVQGSSRFSSPGYCCEENGYSVVPSQLSKIYRRVTCNQHDNCKEFYQPTSSGYVFKDPYNNEIIQPPLSLRDTNDNGDVHKSDGILPPTGNYTGGLANLRGLRTLNLCSCVLVTDRALSSVFNFSQLVSLNLSHCTEVSTAGLTAMASGCGALEVLLLAHCVAVNDSAVDALTFRLTRLRALHVQFCSLLTSAAVVSASRCRNLRYLDITRCCNIGWKSLGVITTVLPRLQLVTGNTDYLDDDEYVLSDPFQQRPRSHQNPPPSQGTVPPPPPPTRLLKKLVSFAGRLRQRQ